MSDFADHFRELLEQRGLSGNAFAHLVDANQSYVSKIMRRERPPPLNQVAYWAECLGLVDEARTRFLLLADLAQVPGRLASAIAVLLDERSPGTSRHQHLADEQVAGDYLTTVIAPELVRAVHQARIPGYLDARRRG